MKFSLFVPSIIFIAHFYNRKLLVIFIKNNIFSLSFSKIFLTPVYRMMIVVSLFGENGSGDGFPLHSPKHFLGILEPFSGTGHLAGIDPRLILRTWRSLSKLRCSSISIAARRNSSVCLIRYPFGASRQSRQCQTRCSCFLFWQIIIFLVKRTPIVIYKGLTYKLELLIVISIYIHYVMNILSVISILSLLRIQKNLPLKVFWPCHISTILYSLYSYFIKDKNFIKDISRKTMVINVEIWLRISSSVAVLLFQLTRGKSVDGNSCVAESGILMRSGRFKER